ncbi:MAG: magnesium transporter CorA family protein [Chloroflexi bacterium]|nr:magnesium transporter CorA family protein [Chloroflexota bacterium]MDA1283293.1 magnesium transporter CorA family protein [Chloroflexota bacterium]
MPRELIIFDVESGSATRADASVVIQSLTGSSEFFWLDIEDAGADDESFLNDSLHLNRIAVSDAIQSGEHTARYLDLGDHEFVLAHGINYKSDSDLVEIAELGVFIGSHFVVTTHKVELLTVSLLLSSVCEATENANTPHLLAYQILDAFLTHIRPTVDHMSDVADDLEEAAINNPHPAVLAGLLRLKRSALRINRAMQRQMDVLHTLATEFARKDSRVGDLFQGLLGRTTRTFEINNVLRERADSAMTIYQGSLALKQNETMKALAIIAAIFLPLSLLAGIYGMNFVNIPELELEWGYFAVVGVMVVFALTITWWVWLRPKISIWRLGSKGLYSLKVPVSQVTRKTRSGIGIIRDRKPKI